MHPNLPHTSSPRKPLGLSMLAIFFALALSACGTDDDVRPDIDTDIIDETDAGEDTDPGEDADADTDPVDDAGEDTDIDPGPTCGDDLMEGEEACDGSDFGGETCTTQGFDGGELGCSTSCEIDTTACFNEVPKTCGDDELNQETEACDGADLGEETCITQGFDGGELGCSESCGFDTSGCFFDPICGDDEVNTDDETCDGADLNGETCITQGFDGGILGCSDTCGFDTSACTIDPVCGDDAVNTDEEACDGADLAGETCITQGFDGGTLGCSDTCGFDTSACTMNPVCGDAEVNQSSEECDGADLNGETCITQGFDGGSLSCNTSCGFDTSACTIDAVCGDAEVNQSSEACDGIDLNGETCITQGFDGGSLSCNTSCGFDTSACTMNPVCGDAEVNQSSESCDGADLGGESCTSLGFGAGTLSCTSACNFDTSGCGPICADADNGEPNDTFAQATALTAGVSYDAAICAGDVDHFTIDVAVGCSIDADLIITGSGFTSSQDIDLELSTQNKRLTKSASGGNFPEDVTGSASTSRYYLSVEPYQDASTAYTLTADAISCPAAPSCPTDDIFEPNDNHLASYALEGPLAYLDAALCVAGTDDWYEVYVQEGCTLDVDLTFNHEAGDLDLRLYAPNSTATSSLVFSLSSTDNEALSYVATQSGAYMIKVDGWNDATNTYGFRAEVTCPANLELSCPADDIFAPNHSTSTAVSIAPTDSVDAILCGERGVFGITNHSDFYQVEVPETGDLTVTLVSHYPLGDLNVALLDAAGERVRTTDSLQTYSESFTEFDIAPGTYTLEVYGNTSVEYGKYNLRTELTPVP
ncbi:hypothetical protein FRC98_20130 [Lujinxingia vulgaris]|uniref:Peptidase C-terminal archaeal/bacterial domain-containing protein n=1 Tax=Lujinxingia vulgaris TaxID=2600176 RepID=A0A5C6WWY0_9DELT|nr:PPC domain-containing protein [Lujinxingia vulgaris]TXD33907.1 hypothetical protein FRC98_20130 [Lujinxingia vulgaris]